MIKVYWQKRKKVDCQANITSMIQVLTQVHTEKFVVNSRFEIKISQRLIYEQKYHIVVYYVNMCTKIK